MSTSTQIVNRLRFAIEVIEKHEDDPPKCDKKDTAEAVAELIRLAGDACDCIERLRAEVLAWRKTNAEATAEIKFLQQDVDINGDLV